MNSFKTKRDKRMWRHRRVRAKIHGTAELPRLSVFRSNKFLHAQIIDDALGRTMVSASGIELKKDKKEKDRAGAVGTLVAERALAKGVTAALFDRGGYRYHGNIKKLADAARKAGLKF